MKQSAKDGLHVQYDLCPKPSQITLIFVLPWISRITHRELPALQRRNVVTLQTFYISNEARCCKHFGMNIKTSTTKESEKLADNVTAKTTKRLPFLRDPFPSESQAQFVCHFRYLLCSQGNQSQFQLRNRNDTGEKQRRISMTNA